MTPYRAFTCGGRFHRRRLAHAASAVDVRHRRALARQPKCSGVSDRFAHAVATSLAIQASDWGVSAGRSSWNASNSLILNPHEFSVSCSMKLRCRTDPRESLQTYKKRGERGASEDVSVFTSQMMDSPNSRWYSGLHDRRHTDPLPNRAGRLMRG